MRTGLWPLCGLLASACGTATRARADAGPADAGTDGAPCERRACEPEDCGHPSDGCGGALDCGECEVTFGDPVAVGEVGLDQREPAVAIDPAGRVWVAFMEAFTAPPPAGRDPRDGFRTRFAVSEDEGATYGDVQDVDAGEMPYSGDPVLAVDSRGAVYLSFIDAFDAEPPRTVWLGRIDEPRPPARVDDGVQRVDRQFVAVGADDAIHVTYVEGFHEPDRVLRLATSTDGGEHFGPSTAIATPDGKPPFFAAIAADGAGRIALAFPTGEGGDYGRFDCNVPLFLEIFVATSDSGPSDLGAPLPLPGQTAFEQPTVACDCSADPGNCPDIYGYAWPDVAIAPDGSSAIVWSRQEPGNPDGARVVLSRSRGGDFAEPVPIDGLAEASPSALFPAVAIDERGVVHAFFVDLRDGFEAGWSVHYVHSDDGGSTFSAPQRLSDGFGGTSSSIGDLDDVAAHAGRVVLAWAEDRGDDTDVLVAVGRLSRR